MIGISRRKFIKSTSVAIAGLYLSDPVLGEILQGKKIKIGQIGTTHSHAENKIATLNKLSDLFEIIGVVESNNEYKRAAEKKEAFKNVKWITEEQLFNTPGLDAVLVETDFLDLLPMAMKCVNAGFHVHVDKPPGKSLEGLKKLFAAAGSKNLIVQMGYMFRYNPAFKFCIDAVKSGLLGEVFQVDGVISKKIKDSRRQSLADSYGGSMMLLGCHLVDMLIVVCGKPINIQSYNKKTHPDKDNLFDNELAVFDYEKATATIRSTLVEVEGGQRRQFVVCGEKGTIEIKPLEPSVLKLALHEASGKYKKGYQTIALPEIKGRYDDQLIDFAKQIKGENTSRYSFEHDLIVHESLLKASNII